MASQTWDSKTDWDTWTLDGLNTTDNPGYLSINSGVSSGTATSPKLQCANWTRWSKLRLVGTVPGASNIAVQFRVATTEGGLDAAAWSPKLDTFDDDGVCGIDLYEFVSAHPEYDVGPWIQLRITMLAS